MPDETEEVVASTTLQEATDKFAASKEKLIQTMNDLEARSKLYMLQPEEIQLLQAFKQFKASIKKPKVFTWMTQPLKVGE